MIVCRVYNIFVKSKNEQVTEICERMENSMLFADSGRKHSHKNTGRKLTAVMILALVIVLSPFVISSTYAGTSGGTVEYSDNVENGKLYFKLPPDTGDEYAHLIGCDKEVTAVVIPDTVEGYTVGAIDWGAFSGCYDLKELAIPEHVRELKSCIIKECGIQKLYIPSTVESIESDFVENGDDLSEITIDPDNPNYMAKNGVIFSKDGKTLIRTNSYVPWVEYRKDIANNDKYYLPYSVNNTETVLPSGVETMVSSCIDNNGIIDLIIPEGVKTIKPFSIMCDGHIRKILIPQSAVDLEDYCVFVTSGSPAPMFYCYRGSAAEDYLKSHDLKYKYAEQWDEPADVDTWKFYQGISFTGNDPNAASYKIEKKGASVVPFKLDMTAVTKLTYSVDDPSVAEVDADGIVTPKAKGIVIVTVTAEETEFFGESTTRVKIAFLSGPATKPEEPGDGDTPTDPEDPIGGDTPSETEDPRSGDTPTEPEDPRGGGTPAEPDEPTPVVAPMDQSITCRKSYSKTYGCSSFSLNATARTKLTYSSSNKNVATVSSYGRVYIKNPGTATITVTAAGTSKYNKATARISIKVSLAKPSLSLSYSNRSAKLTWTRVTGASGYKVYVYNPAKKKYECKLTKSSSIKSVTHKGLIKGKTYYYKVRAFRNVGSKKVYGPYSAVRSVKAR